MSPPFLFPATLILLALALSVGLLTAVARVAPDALRRTGGGVAVLLAATAALAAAGVLSFETTPPTMLLLLVALVSTTVLFARGEVGRRLATDLPLALLVGYQAFRIPVELWLHRGYTLGLFPEQMTYSGLNFDILSGITAIIVAALVAGGAAGRRVVLVWNTVALGLLITIVTIALLSAPVPFRVFHEGPANVYVTGFPGIWLPAILVQGALLGHLLVYGRLLGAAPRATSAAQGATVA